jgi:hypothetical protein
VWDFETKFIAVLLAAIVVSMALAFATDMLWPARPQEVQLVVLHLIVVHGPDGQTIELNVNEISSIREPRQVEGHFGKNVNCLVFMTNGKLIATEDQCPEVLDKIKLIENSDVGPL